MNKFNYFCETICKFSDQFGYVFQEKDEDEDSDYISFVDYPYNFSFTISIDKTGYEFDLYLSLPDVEHECSASFFDFDENEVNDKIDDYINRAKNFILCLEKFKPFILFIDETYKSIYKL